jgi:superfamily II DNA or RNA helicase
MSQPSEASKTSYHTLSVKQQAVVDFIVNGDLTFLVGTTGFGKTSVALHAIKHYLDNGMITQAVVAAPANVIKQWPPESDKWGLALDIQAAVGTPAQRSAIVKSKPQVIVVSLPNLPWLLDHGTDATMVVIDEISTARGVATKKLHNKKHRSQYTIRVVMTATIVAENFRKLFKMVKVLDSGVRLGRSEDRYLNKYFYPTDYKQYNWELNPGAEKDILNAIDDILYNVPSNKAKELPPITEEYSYFDMPVNTRKHYNQMKKDMVLEVGSGVVAVNRAVASGKLRQLGSGFAITEDEQVVEFDTARAEAVHSLVKQHNNDPMVILYEYNHQLAQLRQVLTNYNAVYIFGGSDKAEALATFIAGEAQLLIAQARTVSHGTNHLQDVCHRLTFMQPCWSADQKIQAQGRLHRTGQTKPVLITTVMCRDSIDVLVENRQESKAENMKLFLAHLKENK